jgi:U3 small nucleolar RNA-associated protein 22
MYGTDVKLNFDPASTFARDLQRLYGDGMVVFHDDLGGNVIGLLFNPSNRQPRAFKPFLGYSTKPVQSQSELVEVNREAVLAEIARMGEGLVERIERGSALV